MKAFAALLLGAAIGVGAGFVVSPADADARPPREPKCCVECGSTKACGLCVSMECGSCGTC